ncbi:MAG TPA: zf-HC2 domain-containing protein [Pyrinomonadaceae bacterium]|nr:zf-HC2 domain-containing protein [Pyrinomonadaceae bacterium]
MTSDASKNPTCRESEEIAAYLDGELAVADCSAFELHVKECSSCAGQLREQKRLLCALDFALSEERALPMPANFARVVAAHAQSDMSGVRARAENRRALWLCASLAAVSALLIGGAALSGSALVPLRAIAKPAAAVIGFFAHMLYNAGAGLVVISRVGSHLFFESRPLGLVGSLLLVAALALLPRLIISYHRARIT